MTIGEKIQMCRKQLDLSQEELGQKLLVSRQSVSLWEKDQTVPTIDNLIRLREIFGVSVDEILGVDDSEKKEDVLPKEQYQFIFTKTELKEINRLQKKTIYSRPILFALICVLLIVCSIGSSASDLTIGFSFGLLLLGAVSHIKGISAYNKAWKNGVERICESTYEYRLFDYYLVVAKYRNSEKIYESKYYYKDIEQIRQVGKWIFIQFGGQTFILRKSDLKDDSAFYSYMYEDSSKITEKPTNSRWKAFSVMLFAASLLSIFVALGLVGVVSNANNLFVENMWLFFLLTPIPIASLILGFILKSKGYKYKKNIIVGVIMTALLCLYGSFSFVFANVYDHSDKPIIRTEQLTGIDIPEHKQIVTQDWTKGTQSVSRGYIYSTSDIYFNNSAVEEFENNLARDDKWLSSVSNDLIGITSPMYDYGGYDYVLIYNVDEANYNALPNNSGKYRFINILYGLEDNQMKIVEYDIDYVK